MHTPTHKHIHKHIPGRDLVDGAGVWAGGPRQTTTHPNHEPRPRLTWWRSCCRDRALMAALSACRPGTWRRASGDAAGAYRRLNNLTESRAVFWVAEAEKY